MHQILIPSSFHTYPAVGLEGAVTLHITVHSWLDGQQQEFSRFYTPFRGGTFELDTVPDVRKAWLRCGADLCEEGKIRRRGGKIMTSSEKKHEVFETASAADEILKFKNLLDAGIITQEAFKKKK